MEYIITYSGVFAVLLAVIVLIIALLQSVKLSRINSLIDSEKQAHLKLFEKIHRSHKQHDELLNELKMATRGISEKVIALQNIEPQQTVSPDELTDLKEQIVELAGKLQSMEADDPASRLYTKASKLVAGGASVEEVMDECDLPRAEAELMMNLHSNK